MLKPTPGDDHAHTYLNIEYAALVPRSLMIDLFNTVRNETKISITACEFII